MQKFMRHIGILKNTSKRVVIVFHELPDTKNALVCEVESLPTRLQDAVMNIVESTEAQSGELRDLYDFLSRRLFPDTGTPVINELHQRGYLISVPQSSVIVMPRPNVQLALDKLIQEIRSQNPNYSFNQYFVNNSKQSVVDSVVDSMADLPPDVRNAAKIAEKNIKENVTNYSKGQDILNNINAEKEDERKRAVNNILMQAKLLRDEIKNLLVRAAQIDPSLVKDHLEKELMPSIPEIHREKTVTVSDIPEIYRRPVKRSSSSSKRSSRRKSSSSSSSSRSNRNKKPIVSEKVNTDTFGKEATNIEQENSKSLTAEHTNNQIPEKLTNNSESL